MMANPMLSQWSHAQSATVSTVPSELDLAPASIGPESTLGLPHQDPVTAIGQGLEAGDPDAHTGVVDTRDLLESVFSQRSPHSVSSGTPGGALLKIRS